MARKALYLIILALIFSNANAQEEFGGGSPYTVFGVGDIDYTTSLRTMGMGVLGIGLPGNYLNNFNPAANTKIQYTTFTLAGEYSFLKSTDGVKQLQTNDGNVRGINIGIPFNRNNGWVLNLGFNPYTEVAYKMTRTGSTEGEAYTQTYSGDGGLSRINIGMTYLTFKSLSVGAEYSYTFGNIINQSNVDFTNASFTDTYIRNETDYQGSFFKGGLVFNMQNLTKSRNLKDLSIGFTYSSPINLSSTSEGVYRTSISTDSATLGKSELEIPQTIAFGISNKFGDRVVVAADFLMQDWSRYVENNTTPSNFQNSMRYGLGFELQPPPRQEKAWWESLSYRVGGFYEKSYFKVNNEDISRIGFGLGLGIPISDYNSLDLALTYSTRGKETNGLIKDQLLKLSLGFNFGELWFIRPEED
jgi:hypothetical protein